MKFLSVLLVIAFVTGCATPQFTRKQFKPKGGIVSYQSSGLGSGSRAESARQMIADFCAPQAYEIVAEGNDTRYGGTQFNNFNGTVYATPINKKNTDLEFLCK